MKQSFLREREWLERRFCRAASNECEAPDAKSLQVEFWFELINSGLFVWGFSAWGVVSFGYLLGLFYLVGVVWGGAG